MDNFFFFIGVFLGVLFILIYIFTIFNIEKIPELADAVILFLSGSAVSAGIKICYIALTASHSGEERSHIFIGGVAVIWVSIQTIIGIIKNKKLQKH